LALDKNQDGIINGSSTANTGNGFRNWLNMIVTAMALSMRPIPSTRLRIWQQHGGSQQLIALGDKDMAPFIWDTPPRRFSCLLATNR
jgi:hypothetical protein